MRSGNDLLNLVVVVVNAFAVCARQRAARRLGKDTIIVLLVVSD